MEGQQLVHLDELQDIDAAIFLRDVQSEHGHGILAQHGPSPHIRQFQGVHLKRGVRNPGPLMRTQALNLQAWWRLRIDVLVTGGQNRRGKGQSGGGAAQLDMK